MQQGTHLSHVIGGLGERVAENQCASIGANQTYGAILMDAKDASGPRSRPGARRRTIRVDVNAAQRRRPEGPYGGKGKPSKGVEH